ncbi:hypothetical protein TNCT_654641 [Trichonephila clavata]|uniref:Uncharacterized protein n=1 Tax=Trichonephila clavata TaxID=2740835 RepID=A0A8X6HBA3_TRICU|nr:hypothetical protein TNCT_654641 [Trichonephila clavata]
MHSFVDLNHCRNRATFLCIFSGVGSDSLNVKTPASTGPQNRAGGTLQNGSMAGWHASLPLLQGSPEMQAARLSPKASVIPLVWLKERTCLQNSQNIKNEGFDSSNQIWFATRSDWHPGDCIAKRHPLVQNNSLVFALNGLNTETPQRDSEAFNKDHPMRYQKPK